MINRTFLRKAENNKPKLIVENISLPGNVTVMKKGDEQVFDFGNHYVGYVTIDFSKRGHHQDAPLFFEVQFAEIEEELHQNAAEYNGWISSSWIQQEQFHVDILPASCRLSRRYAFRYVKVRILGVSDNYSVVIDKVSAETVSSADYLRVEKVEMKESDRLLDEVSLRTLHSCMQDIFEDGPKRDRRLWLGDLRLQAKANYVSFKQNSLVKRCLYLFAGSTLEKGRLASNVFTEPSVECDFQTMFDYTLFFISTLWDYYENTNDIDTLKDLESVCLKQWELLRECFDENGLIDMTKAGNVFIDWNFDLDKQASAQAIYIYALKDLLKIENKLKRDTADLEKEIREKTAAALTLLDKEKHLFISGSKRQVSYMSQIWMILAGVVDSGDAVKILTELEKEKEAVKMNSPYAYHHYIEALIKAGLKEKAYDKMHEYWDGMIKCGSDTFWEIYNPENPLESPYGGLVVHSFCHAWSCTPTYFLRKYYYDKR